MIENVIKAYLEKKLSVNVYLEYPDKPAESFVIVDKTGSSRENLISTATFAVQVYAPSKFKAAELNELVKKAMDQLIELDEVTSSKLNTDYPFPDVQRKRHRYQAVYDVTHY